MLERVKDVWQSAVDATSYTGQKAKEVSDELSPHVDKLFNSHPYLKNVIVPVSMTLTATLLAWVVMPRLLRDFISIQCEVLLPYYLEAYPVRKFHMRKVFGVHLRILCDILLPSLLFLKCQ